MDEDPPEIEGRGEEMAAGGHGDCTEVCQRRIKANAVAPSRAITTASSTGHSYYLVRGEVFRQFLSADNERKMYLGMTGVRRYMYADERRHLWWFRATGATQDELLWRFRLEPGRDEGKLSSFSRRGYLL